MAKPAGLAKRQLRTLDRLREIRSLDDFYLAGGSAIAIHLRHRRSLDPDLFSASREVDLHRIRQDVLDVAPDAAVVAETDAVLKMRLGGEAIDIVRYPYPPLEPPLPGPAGVKVAGLRDLAAMKLAAIARRGIRRDFWDLQAILEAGMTLREAGDAYVERFGRSESDLYHVARSLTYFEDAEKDPALPAGLSRRRWHGIKDFFVRESPTLLERGTGP